MQIVVREQRELAEGEEAYGFWCPEDGLFIEENQVEVGSIDTDTYCSDACGHSGLIPVKVVQRTE